MWVFGPGKKEQPSNKSSTKDKKRRTADIMYTEAAAEQVSNHVYEETQSQPVEGSALAETPNEPAQKVPYDIEAEERKEQERQEQERRAREREAALKNAVPVADSAPGSVSPKDDADTVNIENMSFFKNDGFGHASQLGRQDNSNKLSLDQIERLVRRIKELEAVVEQYRERENHVTRKENELLSRQAELIDKQRQLGYRENVLNEWEKRIQKDQDEWMRRRTALQDGAKEEAERTIALAQQEAKEERKRILEADSAAEVEQLVQKKLRDYFDEKAVQEENYRKDLGTSLAETARGHAALIDEMDLGAQAIQNNLNQVISNALTQFQAARDEVVLSLDGWRRKLYKTQYKDFGACFSNLDKLTEGMERRLAKELAVGDEGYHPELAEELKRYLKNMKALRSSFERSLSNLGIRAFYPEPDTVFNSNFHTLETLDPMTQTDDEFNDMPISACVKPGLLRITEAGDEPLLTAVVTVKTNFQ